MESLERYFSVMKDELPAKFRVCRKVSVDVDLDSKEKELWEAHENAIGGLEDLLEGIDGGTIDFSSLEDGGTSLLDLKVELSRRILEDCHFCERRCGVNRTEGEEGFCGVGDSPVIASNFVHHGEEPELVPSYTIFFSGCTFECQFCQNWDISQDPENGKRFSIEEISSSIAAMREKGVKNVNWVGGDSTPNLHNVLAALRESEVNIPSVWNSNMYLSEESMELLRGTQDVYLTDFKYGNDECALELSKAPNYWETVSRNHEIAFADAELIIRHLVLPDHVGCCTENILEWIGEELSENVRVNIMGQYRPAAHAREYSGLSRRVSGEEMDRAFSKAEEVGLNNVIG